MSLLSVNNLNIAFSTTDGAVSAVNGISLSLNKGEALGIVGESGSGKSQLVLGILGLLAQNGKTFGSVKFHDKELIGLSQNELNKIRGDKISMIFQDPMTSLNPYLRISKQMTEVLMLHKNLSYAEAKKESIHMLDMVRIPEAKNRIDMYPHEFSGGMRQRVMIAMSLLCKPDLLIADEPTTALDVTVQAQIVNLLQDLKRDLDTAIILITHDLGVVAGICDNVMVMYAGRTMEYGSVNNIFYNPQHPYTQGLLRSIPRLTDDSYSDLPTIPGNPPSLLNLPIGCPFQERCEYSVEKCSIKPPPLVSLSNNRKKACYRESVQ
ncbi:oligopeptide/dipeptide ABC transporter ATP-binding protein [Fluviispira multicolorata]|uniref:Oligopeptide ABC transporter ATP-binding protein OppD n=1 Tax=Fluviispira multicolorata TaxID=2654512 RepID=A0A833JDZ7_9BACT|nr:oligopeptide/dipeptide ABC transporter ATP-binding protein [Fluviispira multicolorata]KAB8032069.1 oligopeptide ABC transporter ATP-binding protein OppD [Fluviispira multicolorata]